MNEARPRPRIARRLIGAVIAVGLVVAVSACGDDKKVDDTAAGTAAAAPTIAAAWARTSPANATTGAVYMTITSASGDTLENAAVDASVAGMAEVHEVVMTGGEMKMQHVDHVDLPAGTAVELKPGGYHIMLMHLAKPLTAGSTIAITLTFAKAGAVKVDVPVGDEAP